MMGMIKKELLMIKNNYKVIFIALIIFIFYSILFEMDMSFFPPLMGLMVCISSFNYDEYNNWYTYATTLPKGKINIVKSKYLTAIGIILLLTIVSIMLGFTIGSIRGTLKINELLQTTMVELIVIIFAISVLFPILLKYGSEKGRLAMIIICLGIVGIVFLFEKMVNFKLPNNIISFLDSYLPIILVAISVIIVSISYYISKKIYLHKEF